MVSMTLSEIAGLELIINGEKWKIGTHISYKYGEWGADTKDKIIFSNPNQDKYYWNEVLNKVRLQYGKQKQTQEKQQPPKTTSP